MHLHLELVIFRTMSPPQVKHFKIEEYHIPRRISTEANPLSRDDNILQETVLPKEYVINQPSSLREPGTLVLDEKGRSRKQTQAPILKTPKAEPVEFSLQQLSGSQSETILAPET